MNAPKQDDPSKSPQELAADAMFGDGAGSPPPTEESSLPALDEFRAASISAPPFTAERPSNLGGPRERVRPAMPASVVRHGAPKLEQPAQATAADPYADLNFSKEEAPTAPKVADRGPTEAEKAAIREQRLRDSRRGRPTEQDQDSPVLQAGLMAATFAMFIALMLLLGFRGA